MDRDHQKPVVCVVGPTASGKSALAQLIALELDGEIVSADSMQIYRGMDIGTGKVPDTLLEQAVCDVFDLRPAAIIETLDLRRPIYRKTAENGHFGNPAFPWERVDRVDALNETIAKLTK